MPPFRLELWDEEPCNSLTFANGPIIVGAGPSGLAVAACLRKLKIPSLILERADCIASLWKHNTYDRIHLHLPKLFCQLPFSLIPEDFPKYLSGAQFLEYLKSYAKEHSIRPRFNEKVTSAKFDDRSGLWRVFTLGTTKETKNEVREYAGHWLIIASGENAEAVEPMINGLQSFQGTVCHSKLYKCGERYRGKKVLVVGCGNSGMEIALDLIKCNAHPSIVVRNSVHVVPQEILGVSTFALIFKLMKVFPVWFVDLILLFCAWWKWNNTSRYGVPRPKQGPVAYKCKTRRTPVLDIGTLRLIRNGRIKVYPGIQTFTHKGAVFQNGQTDEFDAVIMATGYRNNVKDWLIGEDDQLTQDGLPKVARCSWKAKKGLYTVGFSGMGLPGTFSDAHLIAQDIHLEFLMTTTQHIEGVMKILF